MNVFEKLQTCRIELQNMQLKKSGKNKFANFDYFQLEDFLPKINELFEKHKLFSNFSIVENNAILTIIDTESEKLQDIIFRSPLESLELKGCNRIQSLGGVHTYMKRYLYLNALEIVEADLFDAITGSDKNAEDDNYIYQGLEQCATSEECTAYWQMYNSKVKVLEKFKTAYKKKYVTLKKQEENNNGNQPAANN